MNLNKYIDHTLLKPEATQIAIKKLCTEAKQYNFASVCVNPTWVRFSAEQLTGTDVMVCTVVGFPLGANSTATKVFETQDAIANGAQEIDMVINIGALKSQFYEQVQADIAAVVTAAGSNTVKVIIETCLLTVEEIVKASQLAVAAGAHFVKTSTGFSIAGATVEAVTLMKQTVGATAEIKASGGVRSITDMLAMLAAGATRIGTSSGIALVSGEKVTNNY